MIFRQEYLVPYDHSQVISHIFIDPLSGLYTRMGVEYKIRSILLAIDKRNAKKDISKHCAVILINLDNFKTINDLQGHHVGDVIIGKVGQILKYCFRRVDICGRWGSDEFIVVVQDAHLYSVKFQIEALQKRLSTIGISASIGVTQFSEPIITHNERLFWKKAKRTVNRAEQAMRVGKIFGKNRVVYYY